MRVIELLDPNKPLFALSDDSQGQIAAFLSAALNDPDHLPYEIVDLLAPHGEGYYLIGEFSLFAPEYPDELPPDQADLWAECLSDGDVWLLSSETSHSSTLLTGNELRYLIDKAVQLCVVDDY